MRGLSPRTVSAETDPSPRFAEFIIGRRFAPTRWRSDPLPQGERVDKHASRIFAPPRAATSVVFHCERPHFEHASLLPPKFPPHEKSIAMSFYDATVPAYLQILGSLSGLLDKAEAYCKAKNIQPEVILSARLYPDMLNFTRQVQTVCDFAAKGCARLTGSEVPNPP